MTFCISNRMHKLDHTKKDTGLIKTCVFYRYSRERGGKAQCVCKQRMRLSA